MRGRGGMRGSRQPGFAMLLLLGQMARVGFDKIPPVTLISIASQVAIFLQVIPNVNLPSIQDVCISANYVWYHQDWQRLVLAPFFHLDEWHLYFNMVSLLWKGKQLEEKLGSGYFMYLISVFTVTVSATMVALSVGAEQILHDHTYIQQCAAGFSGVLFALKVVTTNMSPPGTNYVMGFIPVPTKYACWAELVLIHILVPNTSFIGHLAGILVGLMYVKGPLKYVMDLVIPATPSYNYNRSSTGYRSYDRRDNPRYQPRQVNERSQDNPADPYDTYSVGLSEEEQIRRATEQSLMDGYNRARSEPSAPPVAPGDYSHPPPYPPPPHPSEGRPGAPPYPVPPHSGNTGAPPYPGASPYPGVDPPSYSEVQRERQGTLYPDLSDISQPSPQYGVSPDGPSPQHGVSTEEVRRRRLARMDSSNNRR